jgi:hypothetical protein
MPTFRHGKRTAVFLNATDMSPYLNDATVTREIEANDTTTFGSTSRSYIVGMDDGGLSLSGMFDGTANASDAILSGQILQEDSVLTILPEGTAQASRAILAQGDMTAYEVSMPVADVVAISSAFQADGGVRQGFNLDTTTRTASGTATSVDFGSTLSNGAIFHLHVTSNTNGSATTFKVQDSSNNSSFTDVATFTTVNGSATTSQRTVVTTSVNRYLRTVATTGGTAAYSYNISAARR